jgi:ABC-2 type transport system ATP-binding protein
MSSLIVTDHLTKHYGDVAALDDCTLQVEAGEVFGLLGPNGSGKTTLLRLLMGYLQPTRGTAHIAGLDCYRQSVEVHARVAYLPGEARLPPRQRGRDVLRFFSRVRPEGSLQRARSLAERLRLDLSRQVALMSTGMRQKLALAAVLSFDTPIVILDEPTSNLDPTMRSEILALVREARAAGRTVIFSSHVLSEVEAACDRVAILRQGQLVHTQVVSQVRRQHRIRARLTGPMQPAPDELARELSIKINGSSQVVIETPGELSGLLGWLAQAPLAEVHIEPVGLQTVYDKYHG